MSHQTNFNNLYTYNCLDKNDKLILRKNHYYFEFQNGVRLPYLDGESVSFITQKESVFMNFILGNFDFRFLIVIKIFS